MKNKTRLVVSLAASLCSIASQARFLQTDPIGYKDDFNLYSYVGDSPLDKTDPTGECENAADCALDRDVNDLMAGKITEEQYRENIAARGVGAAIAVGVLVGARAVVAGGSAATAVYRAKRFERRLEQTREKLKDWKETPNKKGEGSRFENPENKGDRVRVDKGDPDHELPSQKQDHVRVDKDGKVIGQDGKPIEPSPEQPKPSKTEDAHIPWTDWFKKF